jgi:hypothetical protein
LGRVNEMSVRPGALGGDVLHDHVDVALGGGDGRRRSARLARLVRYPDDRDLGLAAVVRHTCDQSLLHAKFLH